MLGYGKIFTPNKARDLKRGPKDSSERRWKSLFIYFVRKVLSDKEKKNEPTAMFSSFPKDTQHEFLHG